MHTLAGQCIQIRREGRHLGLALTRAHLRNLALVQGDTTQQLFVVMSGAERALRGLADHREGFRQQVIQCRARLQAFAEFRGLGRQLGIAQGLDRTLEPVGRLDQVLVGAQQPVVTAAEDTREQIEHLGHPDQNFEPHQILTICQGATKRRIVRNRRVSWGAAIRAQGPATLFWCRRRRGPSA